MRRDALKVPLKEGNNFSYSDASRLSTEYKRSQKLKRTGAIIGALIVFAGCAVLLYTIAFGHNNDDNNNNQDSFQEQEANTQAQVWPLPASANIDGTSLFIDPKNFQITTSSKSNLLQAAISRYSFQQNWLFTAEDAEMRKLLLNEVSEAFPLASNQIQYLQIQVANDTDALFLGVNESYALNISPSTSTISAQTVVGAMRALETFAQLVTYNKANSQYNTVQMAIQDAPRLKFRGILVDVARHFLNITRLDDILKSMVLQKLNVMLLHLTDDQSFPFASQTHPNLTSPLHPGQVYTHDDFNWLNQRAKEYGIMIQVELDLPGHASSWKGEPEMLICNDKPGSGLINPIPDHTFQVLQDLYGEFVNLFDSAIIHLGGDEVDRSCWENSPQIVNWADQNGLQVAGWDCSNKTICSVECYFHYHQAKAAIDAGFKHLFMWEDVRGCLALQTLDSVAVIDIWDQDDGSTWYTTGVPSAIEHGFTEIVVSSGCYFLKFSPPWASGVWTWRDNYACDVQNVSSLNNDQLQMIIGGHASRWGETSDNNNWFNNTYPSLAGVAEKLWSPAALTYPSASNLDAATSRVKSVLCRMLRLDLGPFDSEYGEWPFNWC